MGIVYQCLPASLHVTGQLNNQSQFVTQLSACKFLPHTHSTLQRNVYIITTQAGTRRVYCNTIEKLPMNEASDPGWYDVGVPEIVGICEPKCMEGRLSPACRQTVTKQLEGRFSRRKQELKDILHIVNRVCTTADCWTSRRRSFMGMTVHWIDINTLFVR